MEHAEPPRQAPTVAPPQVDPSSALQMEMVKVLRDVTETNRALMLAGGINLPI